MLMSRLKEIVQRVRGFVGSQGHWVALGISLVLLGGSAAWVAATNTPVPPVVSYEEDKSAAQQPDLVDRLGDVATPAPTAVASPTAAPAPEYAWPSGGVLGTGYSPEQPVYSQTLGQWQTHLGVDLLMREGDLVSSIAGGIVVEARVDDLMGGTVVIDHGNGLLSTYQSLLSPLLVNIGDKVAAGTPIGGASASAIVEQSEGPHVHITITKDGNLIDPLSILPELSGK